MEIALIVPFFRANLNQLNHLDREQNRKRERRRAEMEEKARERKGNAERKKKEIQQHLF